ncbi:hypothetical protein ACIJH7_000209 [Yersinia enterocolitica]|nr:hypothetical protein [Yersinia enterocolitica]UYK09414.1 hypothetical protein N4226_15270 [Yersinia enterocolitica]
MWTTADGDLLRNDPAQNFTELKQVDSGEGLRRTLPEQETAPLRKVQ